MSDEALGELVAAEQDAPSALAMLNDSEINRAIETAKKYPRNVQGFVEEARAMATIDEHTAGSMFYVLKRGGKKIEGPSTRLAEIVGSSYGNLRYGSRIVDIGQTHITAQGLCFDVQKNISASVDVQRRITYKNGKRYDDDMISVTGNAACSIALRNAIFKVVPMAFVNNILAAAREAARGSAKSITEQQDAALGYFRTLGVDDEVVLAFAEKDDIRNLSQDDIVELRAVAAAIKSGETTIEDALNIEVGVGGDSDAEPTNEGEKPDGMDWVWFDKKIAKQTTGKQIDDFQKEMIAEFPHAKQEIFARCEELREVMAGAN